MLKVLCEHAHSLDPALRLNALWALKHLVDSATVELKKKCVEELESGWLVQLICDDTEDEALFSTKVRGDEMDEDADMGLTSEDHSHNNWPSSTSSYKRSSAAAQQRQQHEIPILRLAEARLTAIREAETNPVRKARQDDLAIQEQGLGFIRNLIGGAHPSSSGGGGGGSADSSNDTTEMIDYLFNTLGQDRLFDILASKLRAKVLHPFNRRGTGAGATAAAAAAAETRVVPPHSKVIEAVIYILVHVAASVPRHRQVVMAQTELLLQLLRLLDSSSSLSTSLSPAPSAAAAAVSSIFTSVRGGGGGINNSSNNNGSNSSRPDSPASLRGPGDNHGGVGVGFGSNNGGGSTGTTGGSNANGGSGGGGGSDKEIRLALCSLLSNLSWPDDDRDAPACSQRSSELRRLGFATRLDHIVHADDELDVRERAKAALWQMKQGL